MAAIFAQPDQSKTKAKRDLSMLVLLYDSAIRLSELLDLTVGSVYLDDDPRIYVVGKGSKERAVAITPLTASHLKAHISASHGPNPLPSESLFFTKSHGVKRRMSPSNAQRLIRAYADKARESCSDMPAKVHPHMFRRTRATNLHQGGVAIELVSRILGHESVDTTKIYAKPSMSMLRDAMGSAFAPDADEAPAWVGNEEEMARLCGLR